MVAPTKQMYFWHPVLKYKLRVVAIGWLSHTQAESQEPLLLAVTRPQGPPQWRPGSICQTMSHSALLLLT